MTTTNTRPHPQPWHNLVAVQTTFAVLFVIAFAITVVAVQGTDRRRHNHATQARTQALNTNKFFAQLHTNTFDHSSTGNLAAAIAPLLASPTFGQPSLSPLLPQGLDTLVVDSSDPRWSSVNTDMGCVIGQINTDGECVGNRLNPDFVNTIHRYQTQGPGAVSVPVKVVPPLHYAYTPGGMPMIAFWFLIYLAASTVGFGFGVISFYISVYRPDGQRLRYRNYAFAGYPYTNYKAWSIVLFPALWIIESSLALAQISTSRYHSWRKAKAETERLAANPVHSELLAARNRLGRLAALPQSTEVRKATADTNALIAELNAFPDQLSAKAASLLAAQVLADNADARIRPQALLAAWEEAKGVR